jgi:ketosteroid isomerase-like protein
MKRITLCLVTALACIGLGSPGLRGAPSTARPVPTIPETRADAETIANLLEEMSSVNLDALSALTLPSFVVPGAGVDVMRVQMDETYTIKGVGKDTVALRGWIAVKHGQPYAARGERTVGWGTAVSATEFVGLELTGESPLFGPVHVSLDSTMPSAGAVGKIEIPFITRVSLDLAYRDYRSSSLGEMGAPVALVEAGAQPPRTTAETERSVKAVLTGVLDAISRKDIAGMAKFYSPSADAVFFNTAPNVGRKAVAGNAYVQSLGKLFQNIKTIKAQPNDDLKVTAAGKLAVATLTGKNDVVDNEGKRGTGDWRWTVELQQTGNTWRITHDHLSFYNDPSSPVDSRAAAAACRANIAVSVNLPKLDLQMHTQSPVQWYSEVTTIPPVGHQASVSLTPTPMVTPDGRVVATLEHGAVNFREVVRHIALEGRADSGQR